MPFHCIEREDIYISNFVEMRKCGGAEMRKCGNAEMPKRGLDAAILKADISNFLAGDWL